MASATSPARQCSTHSAMLSDAQALVTTDSTARHVGCVVRHHNLREFGARAGVLLTHWRGKRCACSRPPLVRSRTRCTNPNHRSSEKLVCSGWEPPHAPAGLILGESGRVPREGPKKCAPDPPCGAKPRGGGGAPPTTLILLRNQRPRVARPHVVGARRPRCRPGRQPS